MNYDLAKEKEEILMESLVYKLLFLNAKKLFCNHKRSMYTTGLFCIINKISFTIISLSSSDKFFLEVAPLD